MAPCNNTVRFGQLVTQGYTRQSTTFGLKSYFEKFKSFNAINKHVMQSKNNITYIVSYT